jgi:predicted deacylase
MRAVERIRGTHRSSDVPVIHWRAGPGPRVAVTAGVHGDELVGFAACRAIDRVLAVSGGEVVLYPALNPTALAARTRAHPEDQGDLNRAFPGNPDGSPHERHAARIWRDLVARRPTALIDLHADAPTSIPYALVDRAVAPGLPSDLEARAIALATASGLPVLREYPPELYRRFGLDHSLAGAALNTLGIPSVTLEIGPRRVVDPAGVATAVAAVLGQLAHLGVNPGVAPVGVHPLRVRGNAPRSRATGLFLPEVSPGSAFRRGDCLGRIVAVDGAELDLLLADSAGIVIGWAEGGWLEVGSVPGTLGLEDGDA